jgi:poly(A) polymerase
MTNIAIATSIVERLQNLGYIAYFAGGWVRDYLLNFPSDDIDIATNASIEVIQAIFPKTLSVGAAFGIVIVVEEGHQFEIATFRKEREYVDGRRPQFIEPCSPEEDAKRRDFTINGLFYDPLTKQLFDFVGGERDLRQGLIKAIGNPIDRFQEDRLRMLRAVRYSTRFGFQIESATQEAIIHHAKELLPAVSWERIYQEFQKMDLYDSLADSFRILLRLKLLKVIFPEIDHLEEQKILSHISQLDELPKKVPLIAKLSLLFHEYPLETKISALLKLKVSRKEVQLVEYIDKFEKALSNQDLDDYSLAILFSHEFSSITLNFFKHLRGWKKEAIHLEKYSASLKPYIDRMVQKNPLLKAEDLLNEGIPSGKVMGKLLLEAEKIAVNEKILDKAHLLKKLKTTELWPFR